MSKELPRDSRSFMWLEDLRRDVAYGVRTLLRTPGFTLVAVLTLALGISAVTVIYSVLRNVALDPFPYSRSDRLVNVVLRDGSGRIIRGPYFRSEEFLDYQEQTTAFEDIVGTSQFSAHWMSDAGAERLALNWMTPNGFDFLGVPPLIGRVFDYRDVAPGAPPVAVMNHRAWVTRFGADRGVIGRTLVLDGQPYTVIGVMPPRFEWNIADLWLPAAMQRGDDPQSPRGARAFQAHLRPGVTAAEAEAQLNVIGARRAAERPNDYPPVSASASFPSSTGWCASSAERSIRSSVRSASCSSSPVATSPICCWRARRSASAKSRFARRSAPAAAASSGSCSSRARCWRAAGWPPDA